MFEELEEGSLRWSDGVYWERCPESWRNRGERAYETFDSPVLEAISPETLEEFTGAAEGLLSITSIECGADRDDEYDRRRWPARLVNFSLQKGSLNDLSRANHLAPFDLEPVDKLVNELDKGLRDFDLEEGSDFGEDDSSRESGEEEGTPDIMAQEGVHEEFMWRLARQKTFAPGERGQIRLAESSLALPPTAICVECEMQGKVFSKSQLARHPDERRCTDCVAKAAPDPLPGKKQKRSQYEDAEEKKQKLPLAYTMNALMNSSNIPVCSCCKVTLTKSNCTPAQRNKIPSRRRCNQCIALTTAGLT